MNRQMIVVCMCVYVYVLFHIFTQKCTAKHIQSYRNLSSVYVSVCMRKYERREIRSFPSLFQYTHTTSAKNTYIVLSRTIC